MGQNPALPEGAYGSADRYSTLPAYRGVEWADELQLEQYDYLASMREVTVGGFRADDYVGQHITVRGGVRKSSTPTCDSCPRVSLWLTGGSAAFGLGQRDEHTIASQLTRLADEDGVALAVTNLGVPGRTLWNEFQDTEQRLARDGETAPDLLVSYGGFNDVVGAVGAAVVGNMDPLAPNVLDNADFAGWEELDFAFPSWLSMQEVADVTTDRFRQVQAQFDELAAQHGIEMTYIFQTDALASPAQFAVVADAWTRVPASIGHKIGAQLEAVSGSLDGSVHNLRHLHDHEQSSVFVDWAHSNELGAELVASEIYRILRPQLKSAADR